jgi:hypothetical protein
MYCKPCKSRGIFTEVSAPRQRRVDGGQYLCDDCAEIVARKHKWTIGQFHKSNAMVITDMSLLKQLNKGGLVR